MEVKKNDNKRTVLRVRVKKDKLSGQEKITGEVEYHRDFPSAFLPLKRDIIVWLPPSYRKDLKKYYPVLYMHDGQNIMDPKTAYVGVDWRVDETLTSLIKKGLMKEIIVVGINNTSDRLDEYSDREKGKAYRKFITQELKQFIDARYRTLTSREHTAIMGSSMGGLCSLLTVWESSEIFMKAACLSSSFYFDHQRVFRIIEDYFGHKKDIRIYIDSGEDGRRDAQKMFCLLGMKGFQIGEDMDYFYDPGAQHTESAWASRLERPLRFLFGK
ncbi:MAG: hypothetical protein FMNOHCHN_03159 [Ignavibacteriaceae bacterium]|nr:hypothetical protein [Ignavibacteriaceae bacterium]